MNETQYIVFFRGQAVKFLDNGDFAVGHIDDATRFPLMTPATMAIIDSRLRPLQSQCKIELHQKKEAPCAH